MHACTYYIHGLYAHSDYQYDRYSPWVTANGFMNFVYMPYNCSADKNRI